MVFKNSHLIQASEYSRVLLALSKFVSTFFPIFVSQLTGNVEILSVKLNRLVVLTKATERSTQAAIRLAFISCHPTHGK